MAAVAGVVVSIGGFALVFYQLRQTRASIHNQTRWAIEQVSCDVYKMFVETPQLRKYFYMSEALDANDKLEADRVMAAAELVADYFETIAESQEALNMSTAYAWRIYMKRMYERSLVLRTFFDQEKERYTPTLRDWLIDGPSSDNLIAHLRDKKPGWPGHLS